LGGGAGNLFAFVVAFLVLIIVSDSVQVWFSALSMLSKVTFNVAKSDFEHVPSPLPSFVQDYWVVWLWAVGMG